MEVIEVMSRFAVIERASIDEAYMDLTASVQDRLKHMSVQDITPQQLRSTYVQGFPQTSSGGPSEDAATDKGVSETDSRSLIFIEIGSEHWSGVVVD